MTLSAYIRAAMQRAHYEIIDQPGDPYYGSIPDCPGVLAVGPTLEACRDELQSVLESWLLLRFWRKLPIPVIDGIDLNEPPVTAQE